MPRSVPRVSTDRKLEAAAIWTSHGLADSGTTTLAYYLVGESGEANPLVAALMAVHVGAAAVAILASTAAVAVVYAYAADWLELPSWFAFVVSVGGVLVAVGNLAAVYLALGWI